MKYSGAVILFFYVNQFWIIIAKGYGSPRKIIYRDSLLTKGGFCRIDSISTGTCRKITFCHNLSESQKRNPKVCSWNRDIPIICCPNQWVEEPETERFTNTKCGIRPTTPKQSEQMVSAVNQTDIRFLRKSLVGAKETRSNSWPWMVSIHKRTGQLTQFRCGGCIISDRYILTAAHCFSGNRSPSVHFVKVGGHTKTDGTNYAVKSIKIHYRYKSSEYYYDIALLEVKDRIRFNERVNLVCLPSRKEKYTNKLVTVLGWGDTSFGGFPSDVLREANVIVMSNAACNKSYNRLSIFAFPKGITNDLMCAGVKEGGVDACQGDSGGPLLIKDSSSKWKIIGVVSFGYQCGVAGYPGVYTRVSSFLPWVNRNM